jgi:diguanylate cyclase (GGDEF)-like protein
MTESSSGAPLSLDLLAGAPEAMVTTALIAGGVGLWEAQLDSDRLLLSPYLESNLGWPSGSFDQTRHGFLARILANDRRRFEQMLRDAVDGAPSGEMEFRVLDGAGNTRWFTARGQVMRSASGQPVRMVGTMQEIPASAVAERRMRRQQAALLDLVAQNRVSELPIATAFECVTEAAAATLEVERVSIWLFSERSARVRCRDLYRLSLRAHMAGAELDAAQYPAYFRALEAERALAVVDAHHDPRTAELAHDYLGPLGISSLLESTVRVRGELVGVVCHEHVGPQRHWLADETLFAASIADLVALVLEADERRRAVDALAASEERYRTYVSISSEAILRVECARPVPVDRPGEEQVEAIRRQGIVAEVNAAFARLVDVESPELLVGRPLEKVLPRDTLDAILPAWVAGSHRLDEHEFDLVSADGRRRCLLGSIIGVVRDGALHGIWSTWRDVTRRKEAVEALAFHASHDSLTGLPNRKWLSERLAEVLAERGDERVALMLMDLDHFKEINDALGHFAGDQLLKTIGPRLGKVLEAYGGEMARLGGDEFAVLIPGVQGEADVHGIAEALVTALREPFQVGSLRLSIDASVGAAIAPEHGTDGSALLRCADIAMYAAKRKHVRAIVYRPDADGNSPRRLALAHALGESIRLGRVQVHYQPIVSLPDGRVTSVEALARLNHPELGLVQPEEFVPIAEMGDQIRQLTLGVLVETARQWHAWRSLGHTLPIGVNLSTRVLLDRSFAEDVRKHLGIFNLPAEQLRFEITESAMLGDPEHALATIRRLHELGIAFAMDDFGTGFSSFKHLRELPLNALKIDRSFVARLQDSERDAAIVRATVNLAHDLGLAVVAEGVETAPLLERVRELGCDEAQGFAVLRPATGAEIGAWLAPS